ncbi:septum formation family protein [Nocardioides dubius]|uniref:Septum formation-related domain-containing protein n=1 Tax=Nocardioides dubius TaxID=317019 RepID=A0ABN1TXS3_9ACTN
MRRLLTALLALVLVGLLALAGCSGGSDDDNAETPTPSATASRTPVAPPEPPAEGACYRLSWAEIMEPTTTAEPVSCKKPHTARTVAVGELDTVVDGHLLAIDSDHVRKQPPARCARAVDAYLGGSVEQRRLSMITSAWFAPTVEASDAGEQWYRCDVVAIAAPERLAELPSSLKGVLDSEAGRTRFGMCGTAQPGTPDFERVQCASRHSWQATGTVEVKGAKGDKWPGKAAAERAGAERCKELARRGASDALNYKWGYEWPTAEQWKAGRRYGICWAPA